MTVATAVRDWLGGQSEAMADLLERLVNVDSGTGDKAGVDRAGEVLIDFWRRHGLEVEVMPLLHHGDAIMGRLSRPDVADQRPILLLGHRDTVFPRERPVGAPSASRTAAATGQVWPT